MPKPTRPMPQTIERNRNILGRALIKRYRRAYRYIKPGLSFALHVQTVYDHAVKRGVPTDHPALEYWATQWAHQKLRTSAYKDLAVEFKRQEALRPTTESAQADLVEQFGFVVELLELWVEFMRKIVEDEVLEQFLAEEEEVGRQ